MPAEIAVRLPCCHDPRLHRLVLSHHYDQMYNVQVFRRRWDCMYNFAIHLRRWDRMCNFAIHNRHFHCPDLHLFPA